MAGHARLLSVSWGKCRRAPVHGGHTSPPGSSEGTQAVQRKSVTVRVARWSATHPWRAMGLWVAFVVATIAIGGMVGAKEHTGGNNAGETARMEQIIHDAHFPNEPATEHV